MKQNNDNRINVNNLSVGVDAHGDPCKKHRFNISNAVASRVSARGITLIALIITIIILLILAGVALTLTIGENGIINHAKTSKETYSEAQAREKLELTLLDLQADKLIKTEYNETTYINERLTNKGFAVNGNIVLVDGWQFEIDRSVPRIAKELSKTDEPQFTKVANAPDISGFNKSNTYYVAWNLNTEETEYIPNEKKMSENTAPNNWYDYTSGVNHWANIKTTGGGNDCLWVWIPRYAYCITEGYHSNSAETIDIKFLKGTTNTPIDGSNITISNRSGAENWNVHPAFWFDKNNNGIEEEGEQLSGIWVAKFEASSSGVSEATVEQDLASTGGGNVTNLKVRVKPNVTSWRGITVGNIFTVCQNLTSLGNSLENTNNIDSHMMKNTEWGAVAYLSRSIYGKNGPVWNNPYYNNADNRSPITGLCGKGENNQNLSTTDINDTCKYNEISGGNASTTGNVYGVYDMAGGVWEQVAGILSSKKSNGSYYDFSSIDTKYYDSYGGYNSKYGDAIYETSSGSNGETSWDNDCSVFIVQSAPVIIRGGAVWKYVVNAGIFAFHTSWGDDDNTYSFRPCLVSK